LAENNKQNNMFYSIDNEIAVSAIILPLVLL